MLPMAVLLSLLSLVPVLFLIQVNIEQHGRRWRHQPHAFSRGVGRRRPAENMESGDVLMFLVVADDWAPEQSIWLA